MQPPLCRGKRDSGHERRPLGNEVRRLVYENRPRVPEEKPERNEHGAEHDQESKKRIAQHAAPPAVVGPEEKRKEKAEHHGHKRGRCKRERLQEAPRKKRHESKHNGERKDGQSRRYRLLLRWTKVNHACIIS